jgi:hypothetical protein
MHLQPEAKVRRVERNGRIDIMHDIPDLNCSHRLSRNPASPRSRFRRRPLEEVRVDESPPLLEVQHAELIHAR